MPVACQSRAPALPQEGNPTRCAKNIKVPLLRGAFLFLMDLRGIRKLALGNSPVDCCNRRGFSAEKESHPLRQNRIAILTVAILLLLVIL